MQILLEVAKILDKTSDAQEIIDELEGFFGDRINSSGFNVYIYDNNSKTLRDFAKSWMVVDDFHQNKDKFYNALTQFVQYDFMLNNKAYKLDEGKIKTSSVKNTILFPLKMRNKPFGIVEINFSDKIQPMFKFEHLDKSTIGGFKTEIDLFDMLYVIVSQISLKIQNIILAERMKKNISFHDTMKNIAKIIETQYDLTYIIPVIGEMIDRFISDHLIYIFLKKEDTGKMELVWPLSCRDKNILSAVAKVTIKSKDSLSENGKMGLFPLVSEKSLLGVLVAYSNIDNLNRKEIDYLEQLSKQASATIHRANVYAEVLKHATIDALTGLNNRRHFETRLKQEVATAKRKHKPLCAMMLDVDFFKKVNDTYGHAVGDLVLKSVSNTIRQELREYDIPSRYGGEEFSILLPFTKLNEAFAVGQRLRLAVERSGVEILGDDGESKAINVTISIGICEYKKDYSPQDLYQNADKALYEAKEHGRNKVVIFGESVTGDS